MGKDVALSVKRKAPTNQQKNVRDSGDKNRNRMSNMKPEV